MLGDSTLILTYAVIGLFTIALACLSGVLIKLAQKGEAWLEAHTSKEQRDLLHKIAAEGVAYAQQLYAGTSGPQKLRAATNYISQNLQRFEIDLPSEHIRAMIEKAYLDLQAGLTSTFQPQPKSSGVLVNITDPLKPRND